MQQQGICCEFSNGNSWIILSPIEQSIKRKMEAIGTPLKDWNIQINYGIKTGFNDAFIITTEKRDEILANCQTEEERIRTDELIRPILRGRDIKRYGYDWADLWIINTHNGIKGKLPRVDVNEYPAIKAHLDQYWDKISTRADKGDTPYNLRNCAYLDLFYKPKICWKAIGRKLAFSLVDGGIFLTAPASFISAGESNEIISPEDFCNFLDKYSSCIVPELKSIVKDSKLMFYKLHNPQIEQFIDSLGQVYAKKTALSAEKTNEILVNILTGYPLVPHDKKLLTDCLADINY